MSVVDAVRAARNPQEAMLALAEGIDSVLALLDAPSAPDPDPWGYWGNPQMFVPGPDQKPPPDFSETIAAVEAELAAATDGEDIRALEARLRLLKDDGRVVDVNAPAGTMATVEETPDLATVTLPAPNAERRKTRTGQALTWELHNYLPLNEAEALHAYVKGGPLWLYGYDRDAVMQMPYAHRQAMVEDVLQDSPRAAHEMGRDILKDTGTGNPAVAGTMLGADIGGGS